jgi:hypothetical protein
LISSPFKKYIDASLPKLETRLDDMVIKCQANETNVSNEMRQIMKAELTRSRKTVADSLLEFLEEKYDTKKWIVLVKERSIWSENSVLSGGFHYAKVRNVVAFAISVDRRVGNFSELENLIHIYLKKFVISPWCSPQSCRCFKSINIANYLDRFLIPVRAKSEVETEMFVFAEMGWQNFIGAISKDLTINPDKIISHSNDANDTKCHHWVIVIPTWPAITFNPSPSPSRLRNQIECSYDPDRAAQDYGPLRNERTQSYLSVQGDSSEEGASIILDRQWRNSSGQKWKFVDGQLRNKFGKCLTLRSSLNKLFGLFHYLYQYNCEPDRPDQKWDLDDGLQIINDRKYCLGFPGEVHQETMFVRGERACDLSPSYIWYNRNTDCEDALVIPSTTNGSRPLRNEYSRLVLDVVNNYAAEQPWSNRPSQLWKFVDGGLLKNDDGECLVGKGWYVGSVDCAGQIGNNGRWTYTENRQIRSEEGYCLEHPRGSQYDVRDYDKTIPYILYVMCYDHPHQRWWYFS